MKMNIGCSFLVIQRLLLVWLFAYGEIGSGVRAQDNSTSVSSGSDAALEDVTISIQVSFMAMAFYIGKSKGYYRELGINPKTIPYPSGAPQIAAAANKTWDIGTAGVVPNILGGAQGLKNIGICFDQSAINVLMAGTPELAKNWPPASLDNVTIASTPNSTGQYIVQACLEEYKLDTSTVNWIFAQQNDVIAALLPNGTEPPRAQYGGLWAPNTYRFLEAESKAYENEGGDEAAEEAQAAKMILCNGEQVYKTVTGGFMVRDEFLQEKPFLVQKVMAAWLRGIVYMKNEANREDVFSLMSQFYQEYNVTLSEQAMEQDMELIGLYNLTEQLTVMKREGNPPSSDYDFSTVAISEFLVSNGVVKTYPAPIDYITDEVMVAIENNPTLKAYANGEENVDLSQLEKDSGSGKTGGAAGGGGGDNKNGGSTGKSGAMTSVPSSWWQSGLAMAVIMTTTWALAR